MGKKIAVTGEGITDYGSMRYDSRVGRRVWNWGPIYSWLKRCIQKYAGEISVEYIPVEKEALKKMKLLRTDKGLDGLSIPARKFRNYCLSEKMQNGVFYADADKRETSAKKIPEATKHFNEVYEEVCRGLGNDGNPTQKTDYFIPMIPLKMIECWLLADEKSFKKCYGVEVILPKSPELIWGDKHSPSSDYPKHYLKRVLVSAGIYEEDQIPETYCELANATDADVLQRKCPISFARFCGDMEKLVWHLENSSS